LEEAIASYQRALDVNPNFSIARDNMAIALTDMGTVLKMKGRINVFFRFFS
jgi:tetratricopeptide (TPR) repeat protein